MAFKNEILILAIFWSSFHVSSPVDPISGVAVAGGAVVLSASFACYDLIKCKFYECCDPPWVNHNLTALHNDLRSKLYGQHLVIDTVVKQIKGHLSNKAPSKALVLSFHGWTGGGKNYVSKIIADNLFKKGANSKYVHIFVATLHFPHASQLETYKDQLREWIKSNVSECDRSVFIFDEMDKMPEGLLDTVKPYIDHYPQINGVDYRKSIFIFLSNTAGNDITKRTLENWEAGKRREEITLQSMEEVITLAAYNEKRGGLWHSSLIEKNLISAFIPFLPLERHHVKMCIEDDLLKKRHPVTETIKTKIADELQYFPADTKLFSKSGCKRVAEKVDFTMEEL